MIDCPSGYYLFYKIRTEKKPTLLYISTYEGDDGARAGAKRHLTVFYGSDKEQVETYALFKVTDPQYKGTEPIEFIY